AQRDRSIHMPAMCSPYAGEASSRSTTFSYALGLLSLTNASTSASEGGRPVSVRLTRLINVARSASGEGFIPFLANLANTKLSIGLTTRDWNGPALGTGHFFGAISDQIGSYGAPCLIHWAISWICSGFRGAASCGMRTLGLVEVMRRISSLCSGWPGTIAWPCGLSG